MQMSCAHTQQSRNLPATNSLKKCSLFYQRELKPKQVLYNAFFNGGIYFKIILSKADENLTYEELNSLLIHAHKRVLQLQKQIVKMQVRLVNDILLYRFI